MSAILVYSHTSYIDVLDICIKQLKKYAEKTIKIYIGINDDCGEQVIADDQFTTLKYTANQAYPLRIIQLLNQIDEEYLLIVHEDMVPTNYILSKDLKLCETLMITHNLWHIRSYMAFGNRIVPRNSLCPVIKTNKYDYRLFIVPQ